MQEIRNKERLIALEKDLDLLKSKKLKVIKLPKQEVSIILIDEYEKLTKRTNYSSKEILSIEKFTGDIHAYIEKIHTYKLDKIALIYEDELMVVVLKTREYKQLQELYESQNDTEKAEGILDIFERNGVEVVNYSKEKMEALIEKYRKLGFGGEAKVLKKEK